MKYRVLVLCALLVTTFAVFGADQCLECRSGECKWVNRDAYRFCTVTWESCSADTDCLYVADNTLDEDPWLLAEFTVRRVDVRQVSDPSMLIAAVKPDSRDGSGVITDYGR